MILYADLETFCETPISYGTHRYAEKAEVLLFGYAIDDEPAKVWDLTADRSMPDDLATALTLAGMGMCYTVWHNGMMFDTVVLKHALGIDIPLEMIIDTMVIAYQHGLPGALGDLCDVFRMPTDVAKDKEGRRLVNMFCKPLGKNRKLDRATRFTHPDDWEAFVNYCRLDVEAERALYKKMPKFNCTAQEHAYQVLDAKINRRGMLMDTRLAQAAVALNCDMKDEYAAMMEDATGGVVPSATQRDAFIAHIKDTYGIELMNLTKAEVDKRIQDETIPEPVRNLLAIRQMSTRTSVKKFEAILNCVSTRDDRLRGCLQFRGAARTGRFSGRLFQPQNLPRPTMKNDEIDRAIDYLKQGDLDLLYADPGSVLPNLLRGEIIAPPGKKLVVADYSNVEGRVLAWLSGEAWKLQAFRDFDTLQDVNGNWVTPEALQSGKHPPLARDAKGEFIHMGHDLYKMTYGKTFNIDPATVTKAQRQMGKVLELALGYGGGAGAFVTFARGYGIDLHTMADAVKDAVDRRIWIDAESSYDFFVERKMTAGLDKTVFIACDAVKRAWRIANPHIVGFWKAVDQALEEAMTTPYVVSAGKHVRMMRRGNYLIVRLPSGRCLSYPSPRVASAGSEDDRFSYMGVEQFTRKWKRIRSYASKVVENITQAVACDLLMAGLVRMEDAGYETVLTIHDEAITEAPNTPDFNLDQMSRLMSALPDWADGLPLVAAGFEGTRYRKE